MKFIVFFFFQAEDGIRDGRVTGVQTCALPISDIGGGLYNEKGFDIPKVIDWVYTQKKPLQGFPDGGTKMSPRDVLFQSCDIAIPAAIENQITEKKDRKSVV